MQSRDLRDWIRAAEALGELKHIDGADWDVEIGAITELGHHRGEQSHALLFDRIKGYPEGYRVLSNTLNSTKRLATTLHMDTNYTRLQFVKDIHWVQAGVNEAGRTEKVKLSLPSGVAIETVADRSLNDLLLAGEIDAMISAREPASFVKRDPRIARLWPDYRTVEEDYYKNTGIFPIMHAVVIKKEKLEQHPWIAMNLFKVFEEAKKRSLQRLSSLVNSRVAIPWSHIAVERAQTLFGEDMWPYGIEANRCTLEAFTQFCFEQGVTDRRVPLSELFPPQLTKTYKA